MNITGKLGDILVISANYEIPYFFKVGRQLDTMSVKGISGLLMESVPSSNIHNLIQARYVGVDEEGELRKLIKYGDYHTLEKTRGKRKESCMLPVPVHARFGREEMIRYRKLRGETAK